jgi:hypothetical protein
MKRFPQLSSFHAKAQVLEIHTWKGISQWEVSPG